MVCYSDLESTLLVHALWQYGVAIPGEVSLVGFNDVFGTRYMTPPLTTIGFDAAKIGELGTRLVLEQVATPESERKATVMTVKPTLIVRGSTGPLRQQGEASPKHVEGQASGRQIGWHQIQRREGEGVAANRGVSK